LVNTTAISFYIKKIFVVASHQYITPYQHNCKKVLCKTYVLKLTT